MNWKGPMPLYPDELNTIVKEATLDNVKYEIPKDEPKSRVESDGSKANLNDVEYIEEYFSNKHDKFVKMAQAYSDYGVLEGKKESKIEKDEKAAESRVKLSADKKTLFGKLKKCTLYVFYMALVYIFKSY